MKKRQTNTATIERPSHSPNGGNAVATHPKRGQRYAKQQPTTDLVSRIPLPMAYRLGLVPAPSHT